MAWLCVFYICVCYTSNGNIHNQITFNELILQHMCVIAGMGVVNGEVRFFNITDVTPTKNHTNH